MIMIIIIVIIIIIIIFVSNFKFCVKIKLGNYHSIKYISCLIARHHRNMLRI